MAKKHGKATAGQEKAPAPYVMTAQDKAALSRFQNRRDTGRPAPKLKVASQEGGAVSINVDHPDPCLNEALFCDSLGTADSVFATTVARELANLSIKGETVSEVLLNERLALVRAIGPQNEIETMLACQMAAIHSATMTTAARVGGSGSAARAEAMGQLNKLTRTFTMQIDALKKLRGNGEQKMIVEHRHYHLASGSQAVFGDVHSREGARKNSALPHESQIPHAHDGAALHVKAEADHRRDRQ